MPNPTIPDTTPPMTISVGIESGKIRWNIGARFSGTRSSSWAPKVAKATVL
jgi:hypothetical protein